MLRAAWGMWRGRGEERPEETAPAAAPGERPFRRALVVSLLNPKAILFFIAFFVQFVDPAYAYPALSFVVLGVFAQIASVLYLSALIFSGTRLAAAFRRRHAAVGGRHLGGGRPVPGLRGEAVHGERVEPGQRIMPGCAPPPVVQAACEPSPGRASVRTFASRPGARTRCTWTCRQRVPNRAR